jgi:hypothetical protein
MNANLSIPELKIRMLRSSFRCFVFGLLGLIPLIGLPFALAALWIGGRVPEQEKKLWNAAKSFRVWGVILAAFGTVLSSGILIVAIFQVLNSYNYLGM